MIAQETTVHPGVRRLSRLERFVREYPGWASFVALAVGDLVLFGWRFDIEALKSVVPAFVAMNPMTALALAFSGLSLWLQRAGDRDDRETRIGRWFAIAIACIGGLRLFGHLLGWDRGIDTLVYAEKLEMPSGGWRDRMALDTALAFGFIGASLALLDVKTRRGYRPSEPLALGVVALSLFALIGPAYDADSRYGLAGHVGTALPAGVVLLALSFGALCARPAEGFVALLTSDTRGGSVKRRLMPAVLAIPVVLGWLRLIGQQAGYFDAPTGTALFVIATVVVLATLVHRSAVTFDRADRERRLADGRTREAQTFLDSIVENVPNMVFVKEAADLRFVRINKAGEDLLGFTRDELIGKNDFDFFPREEAEFFTAKDRVALTAGALVDIPDEPIQTRYNGTRFLHTKKVAITDADGKAAFLLGISEDITEQKAADAELRRTSRQLEAANNELESFSYSVSHDLRAPLRHINGFADLLVQHSASELDATGRRYLDKIRDSAKRMGILIDELLQFSRMSRTEVLSSRVSVRSIAEQVIADLHDETRDRAIEWRVGPLPEVEADPSMLRQVLANLIGNAVKYTGKAPQAVIEIGSIEARAHEVVIFVRDNGVGFDMQYAGKLFGVFQRLHGEDEFEGTGIGLANVRRIIERHGGRTWAEGRVDRGAIFYFSLPLREEARACAS
jgi:PAS domain S-box-containing protein